MSNERTQGVVYQGVATSSQTGVWWDCCRLQCQQSNLIGKSDS